MTDRRRWTIVGLLTVGMMVAFLDRATLSVALASPDFRREFALTSEQRGLLSSAFFWTYALLQIPGGLLVDRWGAVRTYTAGYSLWSLAAGLTAFVQTLPQLFALRMILGIGEAPATPASLRWIGRNFSESRRGLPIGLLFAGAKIGPAVGALAAALLLERLGWRWMFAVTGLGALLWLIPWRMVAAQTPSIQSQGESAQQNTPLSVLLSSPLVWGVMIGTFAYNYFQYFCLTWLPAYFVERRGLSLSSSGAYTMFSFGGMAIVATLAGWWADRLIAAGHDAARVRRGFTIAGFLAASTEVIGAYSDSQSVALATAIISLAGLGLATANYWALTQTLLPGTSVGRLAGIQNFASNLSGVVAPYATGWLIQNSGGYDAPLRAVWFVLIAGLGAYSLLVRSRFAPSRA